jgi:hypothetical protein
MAADVVLLDSVPDSWLRDVIACPFYAEFGDVPAVGTEIVSVWLDRGAVMTAGSGLVIGYLLPQYDALVRGTTLTGVVVFSQREADPVVRVRLNVRS